MQLLKARRLDRMMIGLLLAPLTDGNSLASLDTAAVTDMLAALAHRLAWGTGESSKSDSNLQGILSFILVRTRLHLPPSCTASAMHSCVGVLAAVIPRNILDVVSTLPRYDSSRGEDFNNSIHVSCQRLATQESSSAELGSSGPGAECHGTSWCVGLADLTLAALKFSTSDAGKRLLAARPLSTDGGAAAQMMLLIRCSGWTESSEATAALASKDAAPLFVALVREAVSEHVKLHSRDTWLLDGRLCLGLLWVWTALPALIAADGAAATPLLQQGHPAEWAPAKAALAAAVPQHLRRRMVSCSAAVEDALRGTHAVAAAEQATETAAAAADAAMQRLLQVGHLFRLS